MVFGLNVPNTFELYKLGHGRRDLFSFLSHSSNELLFIVGSQKSSWFLFYFYLFFIFGLSPQHSNQKSGSDWEPPGWLSVSFPVEEID